VVFGSGGHEVAEDGVGIAGLGLAGSSRLGKVQSSPGLRRRMTAGSVSAKVIRRLHDLSTPDI
jgi:hypothetical protein